MSSLSLEDLLVLHVDDEVEFTEMVKEFLQREDSTLSVQSRTNVDDALSVLQNGEVDCIVSDYDMPEKNGLDFLELVRDEHPKFPFILFTGRGSEQIASKAISAGVTDYLQKEGGTDQYKILVNRIQNTVQSYRAEVAIERTEERYHNLVDNSLIPIILFNKGGRAVYSNEAAIEFFNADSHAELEGKPFIELLHPDDRDTARERFERLKTESQSMPEIEYRILTIDGDTKSATVATAYGYYYGEEVAQAMVYQ